MAAAASAEKVFERFTADPAQTSAWAAWLSIFATGSALLLLLSLHFLSPEFSPSWRVISEYALGRHARVLSLMFLLWGVGTWALAAAIRSQVLSVAGKIGLGFLIAAGLGEALASVFDVRHEAGHGIAGILGVLGFPVAALLLTAALRRTSPWQNIAARLRPLAHLSWIAVALLIATLTLMTMQMMKATGGHLPQHAPRALPPGVIGVDGWADRLIVVANCAWQVVAAWGAIALHRKTRAPLE